MKKQWYIPDQSCALALWIFLSVFGAVLTTYITDIVWLRVLLFVPIGLAATWITGKVVEKLPSSSLFGQTSDQNAEEESSIQSDRR